jgi:hypothetical protein
MITKTIDDDTRAVVGVCEKCSREFVRIVEGDDYSVFRDIGIHGPDFALCLGSVIVQGEADSNKRHQ